MFYEIIISTVLVLFVFFVCKSWYIKHFYSVKIRSDIDGREYLVRNDSRAQETADTLAQINSRLSKLVEVLDDKTPGPFKKNAVLLKSRYTGNIAENIDLVDTSYTLNKDEINFCLKTRDSEEKVYDINLLTFVAIHELAHVGCFSIGHGDEFKGVFKYLVKNAVANGLYKFKDYSKNKEEYCGIVIDSTPDLN